MMAFFLLFKISIGLIWIEMTRHISGAAQIFCVCTSLLIISFLLTNKLSILIDLGCI